MTRWQRSATAGPNLSSLEPLWLTAEPPAHVASSHVAFSLDKPLRKDTLKTKSFNEAVFWIPLRCFSLLH